jgi:hypothetical protein
MKALKALVITMGLLIVVGVGLVGYALVRGKPGSAPAIAENPATGVKGGYFTSELPVPKGARLDQVSAAGDRLVLRFSSPEGEKLVLLDSHTGQLAGTISLIPENP